MKRTLCAIAALVVSIGLASADTVRTQWGGKGAKVTYPDTLKVVQSKAGPRLVFDLSAIPKGAKVHHASLICRADRQPVEPAIILQVAKADGETVETAGKPLAIEPPWYRSFDATEAVKGWAAEPASNLGLLVSRFEGFQAPASVLEVCYDGPRPDMVLPEQVPGIRAVHHHGQTFIAFTEHASYRPKPEEVIWVEKFSERPPPEGDKLAEGPGDGAYNMPNHPGITLTTLRRLQGYAVRSEPSGKQGFYDLKRIREVEPIVYRVYRHTERITPANIHQAEVLADVEPLAGYDGDVYAISFKGEYIDQFEVGTSVIPTFCMDKGKHLTPGEDLYVHSVAKGGKGYYAVTIAHAGTENLRDVTDANSLAAPVDETPGPPEPVLQWVQLDRYKDDPTEYWYRYWAAPPHNNLPSQSMRIALAVPNKLPDKPIPLSIGSISGAFNVRGELNMPKADRVTLQVEGQLAWLPELFFNSGKDTLRGMTDCKVDYYSERYFDRMIKWAMGNYQIDRSKIEGELLYFGLRHPEIFSRMSFGAYTTAYDYRWAPGGPSMPRVLGPKGIKTVDGDDAWEMYSVEGFLKKKPGADIPFLICISATGKDSGHTSEFGWQDDPRGWWALNHYRQTYAAAWSSGLPGELSQAFGTMRWDTMVPAFSNCSLNNNPGNGDPADGDYYGQINGWLLWSDTDQTDEKDKWEQVVWVLQSCPDNACTVDVTPRHTKNFKPAKGQQFKWTNTAVAGGKVVQEEKVTADEHGLVTIPKVKVDKGKNRLTLVKQ